MSKPAKDTRPSVYKRRGDVQKTVGFSQSEIDELTAAAEVDRSKLGPFIAKMALRAVRELFGKR